MTEAQAAEEKMKMQHQINALKERLDNGGNYPNFVTSQPEPDNSVLFGIQNLETTARFHTEKLEEILSAVEAISDKPAVGKSKKEVPQQPIYKIENTEMLKELSSMKTLIERLPKEQKSTSVQKIDVQKELAPNFAKLEGAMNLQVKQQQETVNSINAKVSEIRGMISMFPQQENMKKKIDKLKSERDILSERLDAANNQIKDLKERLEASEKAVNAAKATPAATAVQVAPKSGISINTIVQSFVVLLVFIIGFILAKFDVIKKMM